jgi:hypothetical protein
MASVNHFEETEAMQIASRINEAIVAQKYVL